MNGVATYGMLGKNGRLGNCLFQIAATIAYACDNGKMWTFPEWDKSQYFKAFPQERVNLANTLTEKAFHYNELESLPGNVSLDGFFQSESYFKNREDTVRSQLQFTDNVTAKCKKIINDYSVQHRSIISIHFRFGDYIDNAYYVALNETKYYIDAINKMQYLIAPTELTPLFFVFSDDKERADAVMESLRDNVYNWLHYKVIHMDNEVEDLCLMSLCDKAIIANSSFSWWGAWFGNKKTVVAPKDWFGSAANHNTKDLIPENWIKL